MHVRSCPGISPRHSSAAFVVLQGFANRFDSVRSCSSSEKNYKNSVRASRAEAILFAVIVFFSSILFSVATLPVGTFGSVWAYNCFAVEHGHDYVRGHCRSFSCLVALWGRPPREAPGLFVRASKISPVPSEEAVDILPGDDVERVRTWRGGGRSKIGRISDKMGRTKSTKKKSSDKKKGVLCSACPHSVY